jgi:methionine-rich copper-binding protein CopC
MTRSKPVLLALLLGAVYSILSWTVMAHEPLSKSAEAQKASATAKE